MQTKQQIEKFHITDDNKNIHWLYKGKEITLEFKRPIFQSVVLEDRDEILVITDFREANKNNLFIYNGDGSIKSNPSIPELKKPVSGMYSIWYKKDESDQITVLVSDQFKPYATKCIFNLDTEIFRDFTPTK